MIWPKEVQNLIETFSRFPNIGPKTAERFVLWLLKKDKNDLEKFAQMIKNLTNVKFCQICGNISQEQICPICKDTSRTRDILCLVSSPIELATIEKTSKYRGLYFILGGLISPGNIKAKDLKIQNLWKRLEKEKIKEVIFAFSPTVEGETTMLYLEDKIKKTFPNIKLTKLARGLSLGMDLEYADEITLSEAIKNREEI